VSATDSQSPTERRSTFCRTRAVETNLPRGPGDLQSNVGCSAQCISAAGLNPGGTGAELSVDTTVPAKLTISADREAPGTIGGGPIFGTPEAAAALDATDMGKQSSTRRSAGHPSSSEPGARRAAGRALALPQLVAAACQVGGLGGVAGELDGFVVGRARLLAAT
jgi:hypothetical protein